jgi:hypothetical protein
MFTIESDYRDIKENKCEIKYVCSYIFPSSVKYHIYITTLHVSAL